MKYSIYIKIKFKSFGPKLQTNHVCSSGVSWRNAEYTKNITKGQKQSGTVDIFSTNCHGYKLWKGKKRAVKSWLSIHPLPLVSILRSLILHPSTQLPSTLRLTDSHASEASFSRRKNTHTRMHTPPQHLIRCRDSPVSALLFCCVLTGRCWAMLACECVRGLQGSEPHSRLDAQTRTLSLTCVAKRKALQTPQCTCAVCDNKAWMCRDAQFCTMRGVCGIGLINRCRGSCWFVYLEKQKKLNFMLCLTTKLHQV